MYTSLEPDLPLLFVYRSGNTLYFIHKAPQISCSIPSRTGLVLCRVICYTPPAGKESYELERAEDCRPACSCRRELCKTASEFCSSLWGLWNCGDMKTNKQSNHTRQYRNNSLLELCCMASSHIRNIWTDSVGIVIHVSNWQYKKGTTKAIQATIIVKAIKSWVL